MRIVMLTDDVEIDRRILLEANSLAEKGHEIILLAALRDGLPEYEINEKVKIERFKYKPRARFNLVSIIGYVHTKIILGLNKISTARWKFIAVLNKILIVRGKLISVLNHIGRIRRKIISILNIISLKRKKIYILLNAIAKTRNYIISFLNRASLKRAKIFILLNAIAKQRNKKLVGLNDILENKAKIIKIIDYLINGFIYVLTKSIALSFNIISFMVVKLIAYLVNLIAYVMIKSLGISFNVISYASIKSIAYATNLVSYVLIKVVAHTINFTTSFFVRSVAVVINIPTNIFIKGAAGITNYSNKFASLWAQKISSATSYDEELARRVIYYNPDLIHAHDLPQLKSAAIVKRKLNIPLVYDAHELYPEIATLTKMQQRLLTNVERKLIKKCDVVITVNSFIADEMAKRYQISLPTVIHNATNLPVNFDIHEKYDRFRNHFNLAKTDYILLFQGWMSKSRGLQELVNAMPFVPKDIHLVFMGYGEVIPDLKALSEKLNIVSRVHFMDAVSQNDLLFWTASADVGIIPYQPIDLNNYYCSPNKLFEFIQARLPIIANDLPFLSQVIKGENFGITEALTNYETYSNAISRIFSIIKTDPNYFKNHLAQKADQYSWESEKEKLFTVYEKFVIN